MIYTISTVTVKKDISKIDRKIILYKGDRNIEIQFEILEGAYRQYKMQGENTIENLGASYGQLLVKKPNSEVLISDIVETKDGRVIFTLPQELLDEDSEVGFYTFQIVLFDETQESKVTLPPVIEGIEVKKTINE